jgi:hypothetical protein
VAIVDLGGHTRALRQGAVLDVATVFGELHELPGAAGYRLNGGIRGEGRALDHPAIGSRSVVQGDETNVAAPKPLSIDTTASWAASIP